MKVGDRVKARTTDEFDGYSGTIVEFYDDAESLEYDVDLDEFDEGQVAFSAFELEVIEDA